MQVQSLGYRTDLVVRRLAGSQLVEAGDHLVVRTPANPSFYWGNFILVGGGCDPGDHNRWCNCSGLLSPSTPRVEGARIVGNSD